MTTAAETLAAYAVGLRYEALPESVIERARVCLADAIGCAAFGARFPWSQMVLDHAKAVGSGGPVKLPGLPGVNLHVPQAALALGTCAMILGLLFKDLNASFLVGWAFNIAASANLPALLMALFWKRATKEGIATAIIVGLSSSLVWVLLSKDAFEKVYGLPGADAWMPFSQPALVTIPLGAVAGILVSLATRPRTQPV